MLNGNTVIYVNLGQETSREQFYSISQPRPENISKKHPESPFIAFPSQNATQDAPAGQNPNKPESSPGGSRTSILLSFLLFQRPKLRQG
jgi:hypothetical protein